VKSELHIGPAGWSYPDWEGVVYPRRKPRRFDFLEYITSYFNLVEVNSTFYRIPATSMCASWARRVAHRPDFRFTVKLFREFTHGPAPASEREVAAFKSAIAPLRESGRLSAVLVQFPWSFRFSPENVQYVSDLVEWLSPLPSAVEVRHGDWGSDSGCAFFRDNGITMCGIDQPLIGRSLPPERWIANGAGAYFRLHGRNRAEWFKSGTNRDRRYDYLYSKEELTEWVARVEEAAAHVNRIHVVLNNHFRGQAVANALAIAAMIAGRRVPAPPGIRETYPGFSDLLEGTSRDEPSSDDPDQRSLFDDRDH
jgi:uncharacterized protein YecE (DUF72 family)